MTLQSTHVYEDWRDMLLIHRCSLSGSPGGSDGIRDAGLLDSAIHAPFQAFADRGNFIHRFAEAARLGFGGAQPSIRGRQQADGDPQYWFFLSINQIGLNYEDKDLISDSGRSIGTVDYNGLLSWLQCHIS